MSEEEGWAQLVSLTDIDTPPIFINSHKFIIGRASDCDICLSGNKLVSGYHCHLLRDEEGRVWLCDTSTNGTLLNMEYKVTKGSRKQLTHGDEIYIVYRKNNEELNVGYVYQDMEKLREEEGTQEYSPPELLDSTLTDDDVNEIILVQRKRKQDDNEEVSKSEVKRSRPTTPESAPACNQDDQESCKAPSSGGAEKSGGDKSVEKEPDEKKETTSENTEEKQEDKTECLPKTTEPPKKDDIEENLLCIICQEIMHDCISLQPCLHSFCAGCYSDWMVRSEECPSCRKKVKRINKNHIVNNLIEAYLKEHTDKKRPDEDIKELNEKNKVTKDMLYPKHQNRSDSSDYSDSDESRSPSPILPPAPGVFVPPPVALQPVGGQVFGFGTPFFGATRPARTVCRQCPDYKDPGTDTGIIGGIKTALNAVKNIVTGGGTTGAEDQPTTSAEKEGEPASDATAEAGPSTSGASGDVDDKGLGHKDDPKVMPDPIPYVCLPNQNHVLCQCCLQPMPDLRAQVLAPALAAERRAQQCTVCYRAFCHAYWGCRKMDCLGCLNKFKEMNFGRKCLNHLILDNPSESAIFRDYIDQKKMSVKDVLQECVRMMDSGKFTCPDQVRPTFNSNAEVCYNCGIRNFKSLALQYRKTIPKDQLPEYARKRPDCYWGQNCRTQRNKPQHAANFNHVCDQTRF